MSVYTVHKKSGTYSELLETYGLANLLHKIFDAVNLPNTEIVIADKEYCFEVSTGIDITDDIISKLKYFPPFKYIKQKADSDVSQYPDYFDYPTQYKYKKEQQERLTKAYRNNDVHKKREEIEEINKFYREVNPRDIEYDVYSQIQLPNNYSSFEKLYATFFENREHFSTLIKYLLNYYQNSESKQPKEIVVKDKAISSLQLYNPNQGKGLKGEKANSVAGLNFKSFWISEAMKVSGALSDMICQLVKVGSSYDMKVFVPEYKQLNYSKKADLIPKFKEYAKGNTPIKIDVLYILLLTKLLVEKATEFSGRRRKVKDIVSGLHSVYQKDLGNNKAVVNIGFLQIPNFIEIGSKEDVLQWSDVLDNQMKIISGLKEENDATPGLMMYRNFFSGSNIYDFFKFSFWYADYLMSQLSKQQRLKSFTIELFPAERNIR